MVRMQLLNTLINEECGGGRLTVIHDGQTKLPDESILSLSELMVVGARDALWCAIDHLRRHPTLGGKWKDVVDALAYHCFRYGAKEWPAKNDVDTMRRIFIRTLNGILGNQTVVIKDLSEDKAAGLTLMVKDQKNIEKAQNMGKDVSLTKVRAAGQSQPVYWLAGDITIDWKTLRNLSQWYPAIQVCIHEATHKHGGTIDAFYIHSLKMLPDTSVAASYEPGEKSPKQSLKNADSYAWFAYTLWVQTFPLGY
jgi:hypothetical protein